MDDANTLYRVILQDFHTKTGKTKHYVDNDEIDNPVELRIVQYKDDNGYYLLYIGFDGEELADTYHDTVEQAKDQANWEFNVNQNEWTHL